MIKIDSLMATLARAKRAPRVPTLRRLMKFYFEKDRPDLAEKLFKDFKGDFFRISYHTQPDDGIMIMCEHLLNTGQITSAVDLATCPQNKNNFHRLLVYRVLLFACSWNDENRVKPVLEFLEKHGPHPSTDEDFLVLMRARFALSQASEVTRLFDRMIQVGVAPTEAHCNLIIQAHLRNKEPKKAINMFEEMQANGIAPTTETFSILMKYHALNRSDNKVNELWQQVRTGLPCSLLARHLNLAFHCQMLKDNVLPDGKVYTAVLLSKFSSAKWQEVLNTYEAMQIDGIVPEPASYAVVLHAMSVLRQFDQALTLAASMPRHKSPRRLRCAYCGLYRGR